MIKLNLAQVPVGHGTHRGGWPEVMTSLRPLHHPGGLYFNDFAERSFGWEASGPIEEPWIGVFHFPPEWPGWLHPIPSLPDVLNAHVFRESLPHLRAAIALSGPTAAALRAVLECPVYLERHPTNLAARPFCLREFERLSHPLLLQVGWTLRNQRAIYQVRAPDRFHKVHLVAVEEAARRAEGRLIDHWQRTGTRSEYGHVTRMARVSDAEYDDLLARSIVFVELLPASAVNTILECIARNTPVVVNRCEATREYLGENYPMLYDDIAEVRALLSPEGVVRAHQHLCSMDKSRLEFEYFRGRVATIARTVAHLF